MEISKNIDEKNQEGILDRLYQRYGKAENLSDFRKAEIQAEFAESFIREKPNKGLLGRLFRRTIRTSERLTKEELASKLVDEKLAKNFDEAKGLIPDVVSRQYKGNFPVVNYEFERSVDEDRNTRWKLVVGNYYAGGGC